MYLPNKKNERVFRILERNNWGWAVEFVGSIPNKCDCCKRELGSSHVAFRDSQCLMYVCEQNKAVYCKDCVIKHPTRKTHSDWNCTSATVKTEEA